jgi:hypothetical protein
MNQMKSGVLTSEASNPDRGLNSVPSIEPHGSTTFGVDRIRFLYPGRCPELFTFNHFVVVLRAEANKG